MSRWQTQTFKQIKRRREKGIGHAQLMAAGVTMVTLMLSPFAIDLPLYFTAQNQLQTAVDSAALAGAYMLPEGQVEAEEAAYEVGSQNLVAGQELDLADFNFNSDGNSFTVTATKPVPTVMSRLICGMQGTFQGGDGLEGGGEEGGEEGEGEVGGEGSDFESSGFCELMTVGAKSKAIPAARDTILVVDTSSSMRSLSSSPPQPFTDVQEAAEEFVNQVQELDSESVDRIAVVSFDRYSYEEIELTSANDSGGFDDIVDAIDDMDLWNQGGWNTNYYAGLKKALDEMEENGRENATKTIVFLTDGFPNLPDDGPTSIYTCSNYYNNGENYEYYGDVYTSYANYYYNRGYTSYGNYYSNLADDRYASANYYHDLAQECTEDYLAHIDGLMSYEISRAIDLDVTIHTIQIGGSPSSSNTVNTFRAYLQDEDWVPTSLDEMAVNTDGQQYAAATNDGDGITEIYQTIAMDVHMRLTSTSN